MTTSEDDLVEKVARATYEAISTIAGGTPDDWDATGPDNEKHREDWCLIGRDVLAAARPIIERETREKVLLEMLHTFWHGPCKPEDECPDTFIRNFATEHGITLEEK